MHSSMARRSAAACSFLTVLVPAIVPSASAQDRLKSMPGYEQYQRMAPLISTALRGSGGGRGFGNTRGVTWSADSKAVEFDNGGKRSRFDLRTQQMSDA